MAAQVITGSGNIATGYVAIAGIPTDTSIAKSTILTASKTFRNLFVTTQDPQGGGSVTVTTRKNGVATSSTTTISAGNNTGEDNTHTVSGVAGDVIDWTATAAGGALSTSVSISMEMD